MSFRTCETLGERGESAVAPRVALRREGRGRARGRPYCKRIFLHFYNDVKEKLRLFDKKHGRYCCALRGSPLPHRPPRVSSLAANCAAESTTCDYAMSNEEAMRGDHFNRFSSIAKVLLQMLQQRHHDYIKTRTAAIHRTRWILPHAFFPGRTPPRIFSRPPLHSSTPFSPSC